ncbi:MAG: hypothetical protein WA624_16945, partial [Methylocella sp.]
PLGERESGTEKLEGAVEAYRKALEEFTEKTDPYWHSNAEKTLDRANALLAERRGPPSAH